VSIGRERRLQLLQRTVRLGRNQREDAFGLCFDRLRAPIAALRLRRYLARLARLRHKVRRSLSTRHTALNGGDHTPAKIDSHACRPPAPSRQFESLSA